MTVRSRFDGLVTRVRGLAREQASRALPRIGRRLERLGGALQSRFDDRDDSDDPNEASARKLQVDDLSFEFEEQAAGSTVPAGDPRVSSYGALPPIEVPEAMPMGDKLMVFAESVRAATGSYAVFIADSQGLPLISRHSMDDHVAISAALDQALGPIRASLRGDPQGSASIELDADNVLQVIWVNTVAGRYALGLIVPQSLGGEVVDALRAQLAPIFLQQGNAA